MALEIEQRNWDEQTAVVALRGKLMLGKELSKMDGLVGNLVAAGCKQVVFDLSGLEQIDSTGIGRFIEAYHLLEKSRGRMVLAGARGPIRDLFRITRLDTVFDLAPSVEAAMRAPSSSSPA